jgi:predicted alpha/beta-hydrolase family hydrolase
MSKSDWEEQQQREAEYETARLARTVMTGPVVVGLATLGGPVTATVAAVGWGLKAIFGRVERDRERDGE